MCSVGPYVVAAMLTVVASAEVWRIKDAGQHVLPRIEAFRRRSDQHWSGAAGQLVRSRIEPRCCR